MKIKILIILLCVSFLACKEEFNKPFEKDSGITGSVTNVSVENTPGGALISYTVPSDVSLSYVLAEIEGRDGSIRQFKSSRYSNTIQIDGIGDTAIHDVKLYTVNKSENRSGEIGVKIKPLKPPFMKVFETVELMEDFGGINVKFENETEADIAVVFYANDSLGQFKQYGTYHSKRKLASHTFRGMKSENTKIGVIIRDRWGNESDPLITEMTPLYEVMVKKPYADVTLDNDAKLYAPTAYLRKEFLWDNDWPTVYGQYGSYKHMATEDSDSGDPLHITFDLKVKTRLSRMRLHHYWGFENKTLRKYEIWGHPGSPSQDGNWTGWVKLAEHEVIKPSGAGPVTDEDRSSWLQGDNINFPTDIEGMRYIRIKCLENWTGLLNFSIAEVTFWGGATE